MTEIITNFAQALLTYQVAIYLVSASVSVLIGFAFYRFQAKVLRLESWARYFGAAYLVSGIAYGAIALNFMFPSSLLINPNDIIIAGGPPAKNALFWAVSFSLLGRGNLKTMLTEKGISGKILMAAFGLAILSFLCNWLYFTDLVQALFSVITLMVLGFALSSAFQSKLAKTAIGFLILVYAGLDLLHSEVVLNLVWPELLEGLRDGQTANVLTERLHILAATCMLPASLGLAFIGFLMLIQVMLYLAPGTRTSVRLADANYLSRDVPGYIAELLNIPLVCMMVKKTGDHKQPSVLCYQSHQKGQTTYELDALPKYIRDVFEGSPFIHRNMPTAGAGDLPAIDQFPVRAAIAVPITRGNYTFGCLYCAWRGPYAFSATIFEQLFQIAATITNPLYTARRQVAIEALPTFSSEGVKTLKDAAEVVLRQLQQQWFKNGLALAWDESKSADTRFGLMISAETDLRSFDPKQGPQELKTTQKHIPMVESGDTMHTEMWHLSRDRTTGNFNEGLFNDPLFLRMILARVDQFLSQTASNLAVMNVEGEILKLSMPRTINHEFKNQMVKIGNKIHLMGRDLQKGDLAKAGQRLAQLDSISRSALKISQNKLVTREEDPCRLSSILEELKESNRAGFVEARKIGLIVPAPLPNQIMLDISLKRVCGALFNLIDNAVDAMERGKGTIELSYEVGEQYLRLHVTNTGIIPAEVQDRIFDRGYSTMKGDGVGLPISRDILKQRGGDLKLAFSKENQTRFTMILPIIATQRE